jgi:DNA-binding transcriptional ArsR family regulator
MSNAEKTDSVFKALADPTRRRILDLIREAPASTGDLCKEFEALDRCTVMMHLNVLEQASLIIVKREGRVRWNYINAVPIQRIYDRWISQYAAPSAQLLRRLADDLE